MDSECIHLLGRAGQHDSADAAESSTGTGKTVIGERPAAGAAPSGRAAASCPPARPPPLPTEVPVLLSVPPVPSARLKTRATAYLMWFPFGLLGFHHFYLGNWAIGFNYLFTLGLFGFGWLVDLWRIPMLVAAANDEVEARWIWEHEVYYQSSDDPASKFEYHRPKRLSDCYILGLPTGFLGFHHHYLERHGMGLLYMVTAGLFGVGVISDWFRMPVHLRRYNQRLARRLRRGGDETEPEPEPDRYHLDEAYVLAVPGGLLGFHHFYLGRHLWGLAYLLTLAFLGAGLLVDLVRMPLLVEDANLRARSRLSPLDGVQTGRRCYRALATEDEEGWFPPVDPYYSDYNSGRSQRSLSGRSSAPDSSAGDGGRASGAPARPRQAIRRAARPRHFKEFKAAGSDRETSEDEAGMRAVTTGPHGPYPPPSASDTRPPPYFPNADTGSAADK